MSVFIVLYIVFAAYLFRFCNNPCLLFFHFLHEVAFLYEVFLILCVAVSGNQESILIAQRAMTGRLSSSSA